MDPQVDSVERRIARIASRAHGVVTRSELLGAAITPEQIRRRVRSGALIVVYRGVYRVGHAAPSVEARYMAAVKASGPGAVLSGRAAAWLLGLLKGRPPAPEVTAPTARRVPGVRTRRALSVPSTTWRGIPATTVPRTLVDLAAHLSLDALARACHEAGVLHKTTPRQVMAVMRPNSSGRRSLEIVCGRRAAVSLSRLERGFLKRLDEAVLRRPDETNRPAGGRRVDCRWLAERLTVELDSFTFHNSLHSWRQDRRRDRETYARGEDIRRYTPDDVFDDPQPMLRELSELLDR